MVAHLQTERSTPFGVASRMSIMNAPVNEPLDWSCDMDAVAQRRDQDSFMRIYDHFMPRLCRYLRGMGTPEPIAEELAQEALLRLWQHAAGYDPARSAVSTWLFRIARNLHIDRARREPAGPYAEGAIMDEASSAACPTEDYADHVQLRRRIDALSAVQARLIRMSFFEAKSHQEIASELGMPLGTVKSHIRRAFLHLQGELGGNT